MTITGTRPLSGWRILVVEDGVDVAMGVTSYLQRRGAYAEIKASMEQALICLRQGSFDLVLMDNALARSGTGAQLALTMAGDEALCRIVRVSYSGSDPAKFLAGMPDNLFNKIIPKGSITTEELVQQLRALLEEHNIARRDVRQGASASSSPE